MPPEQKRKQPTQMTPLKERAKIRNFSLGESTAELEKAIDNLGEKIDTLNDRLCSLQFDSNLIALGDIPIKEGSSSLVHKVSDVILKIDYLSNVVDTIISKVQI